MRKTPLLVLAYNRPDKMRQLISNPRATRPETIVVAVDGSKAGNDADLAKVRAVQELAGSIDWTDDVETRFRPVNIGLRASVAAAVTWAVGKYGQTMVIEDDALEGPEFVFTSACAAEDTQSRVPSSISACRTHRRTDSWPTQADGQQRQRRPSAMGSPAGAHAPDERPCHGQQDRSS